MGWAPLPTGRAPCDAGSRYSRCPIIRGLSVGHIQRKSTHSNSLEDSREDDADAAHSRSGTWIATWPAIHFRASESDFTPIASACKWHFIWGQDASSIATVQDFEKISGFPKFRGGVLRRGAARDSSKAPKTFAQIPFPCGLSRRLAIFWATWGIFGPTK